MVFHIGALQVHTYGIGLAVTFWFALVYMRRRFQAVGLPWEWLNRSFLWIIGAAIVGARAVHVVANFTYYRQNPGQILAVWHGGLSSFGGLLLGVLTALWLKRRHAPDLDTWAALDVAAPVLMAAWALGRLLGPQVMVNGGGHPTSAWYGMSYACTAGTPHCLASGFTVREVPVPIFQSLECFAIFLILRRIEERTGGQPRGVVLAAFAGLWGIVRFTDEFFWLAVPRLWDAVEVTGIVMAVAGWAAMASLLQRRSAQLAGSELAGAAPPGGAAAGPDPYQPTAVPGADPPGPALGHQVTGVGPAPDA